MKCFIYVLLLIYTILFINDVQSIFTKEDCLSCCTGLTVNSTICSHACFQKFFRNQDYNSRQECVRSCLVALSGCRDRCFDDCAERYDEAIPGTQALPRREKQRHKEREARRALALQILEENRIIRRNDIPPLFTQEVCFECCRGLTVNSTACTHACRHKFSRDQAYNGRQECLRSCSVRLSGCRDRCVEDCIRRYDEAIPGVKELSRRDKQRQEVREARKAAALRIKRT